MVKKPLNEYKASELEAIDAIADEQETTLQRDRNEKLWHLWTSDNLVLTKMKKMMAQNPEGYKLTQISWTRDGTPAGYGFDIDLKLIGFKAKRLTRTLTEEQKAALSARAKEMQQIRKNKAALAAEEDDEDDFEE